MAYRIFWSAQSSQGKVYPPEQFLTFIINMMHMNFTFTLLPRPDSPRGQDHREDEDGEKQLVIACSRKFKGSGMGLAHIVFSENRSSLLRFFENIAYNATECAFLICTKYSAFTTREYKFTSSSSSHCNYDILCSCPCITSEVFEPPLKCVGPNTSWNLPFWILHGPPMKYVDLQRFHWSLCTFKLITQ